MINLQLTNNEFKELYRELCRMREASFHLCSTGAIANPNWWRDRYVYLNHIIRNLASIAASQGLDLKEVSDE